MKLTRMLLAIAALALFAGSCVANEESQYRTFKLNPTDVAVACKSGATPKVKSAGTVLIVSCSE